MSIRELQAEQISEMVRRLCLRANLELPQVV